MVHGHFSSSDSVANIFGNWLHGIEHFLRWERLSLFGRSSYFEMIKCLLTNFFSLTGHLLVCTGTLRLWSTLQRMENHDQFTKVCTRLETAAMDTFIPI
jgi:hypothetical protein